jgi:hypothetical protein
MIDAQTRRYIDRHFWTIDDLADATGTSVDRVRALIAAGCAPGPVYVLGDEGWWSALDRDERAMPEGPAWYSPGAAWGIRRASLVARDGASDADVATMLARDFAAAFVRALAAVDGAATAFPGCFVDGAIDTIAAHVVARAEWDSWLDGGYAVCLRVFTAATCVMKETLAARMKAALATDDYDAAALLVMAEQLAGIILPFAPWQRPTGTPGRTIDRLLAEQALGRERPYD